MDRIKVTNDYLQIAQTKVQYSVKISKCRDGFFSRGDNTAFFIELGIEAELNERFTTLSIIGSKSSIQ